MIDIRPLPLLTRRRRVRDPALTHGRWVLFSPLVWAVAAQKKAMMPLADPQS